MITLEEKLLKKFGRKIILHSKECKRKEGGSCNFCLIRHEKTLSKWDEYEWIGLANLFGKFEEEEILIK